MHGYRPCKVCLPLNQLNDTPNYINEILSHLANNPFTKIKDFDLIRKGIEPNKVRRWFKKNHGITFHSYQRMLRINNAYKKLSNGEKVTNAAFDSGYDSLSGFFEAFKSLFGDTPSNHKDTKVINITRFTTPIGPMFACATDEGICLLEFTDRRMLEFELKEIRRLLKAKIIYGDNLHFKKLHLQLKEYFEGTRQQFDLPLVTPGTDFQIKAWNSLKEIPYGTTTSYKRQAAAINNPKAVRAVAKANGFNRISIIIPCHRVIGEDGNLTGYGGGLRRKKWLLDFEKKYS